MDGHENYQFYQIHNKIKTPKEPFTPALLECFTKMVSTNLPVLITAKTVYHKLNYLSSPCSGRGGKEETEAA